MNIRCANCELEFAYDPPPFASGGTARCPRCGHGNDVDETSATSPGSGGGAPVTSAEGAGGDADQLFCFNCGKPMQANPQELIPVCSECKAGSASAAGETSGEAPVPEQPADAAAAAGAAELMVRKSNGQVYGPFPEETIVEWIRAGKIHPDEEVSKIGGAWKMFSKHDHFSTFFPDVKKTSQPVRQEVQFKKVSAARESVRSLGKILIAVFFLAVVGTVVYYLVSRGTLAIPESVIGSASDAIQGAGEEGGDAVVDQGRAAELIREIQGKYPELEGSAIEHYYRAREAMGRGNVDDLQEAVVHMEKAIALDPTHAAALAGLGQVYTLMAHEDDNFSSLLNNSFYFIDLALESRDYELEAHKAKAWFLYHTDNLDKAITHVNFALEVDPSDPEAHMLLGMCNHGKLGQVKPGVRAHFDKALELAPDYSTAHYQLGRCHDTDGDFRAAIEAYTAKIAADPEFVPAHLHVAKIYEQIGDYELSVAEYEQVLKMSPMHREAILRLGRIHTQVTGDAKRAASLYQRLAADESVADFSNSNRLELATGQASALRLAGDHDGACAAADEALKVDDSSVIAHFEKGMCEHARGDIDPAGRAFNRAVTLASDWSDAELARLEFFRGVAYYDAEQYPDALESFDRVINLDDSHVPAAIYRAGVFAKLGQFDRVKGSLRVIRAADPLGYRRGYKVRSLWSPIPPMAAICRDIGSGLIDVNFDPELFGLAGAVCYHAGDGERAKRYLDRSAGDDPRGWAPMLYSALMATDSGKLEDAAGTLDALTSEHRDVPAFRLIEGDVALAQGELALAERSYTHVLQYERDLAWGHAQLGQTYARLERPDEARRAFKTAAEKDPDLLAPLLGRFEHSL